MLIIGASVSSAPTPACGGEQARVLGDRRDVLVLGDRPEASAVTLAIPVHGILAPQP
jgi:hypothetical protein